MYKNVEDTPTHMSWASNVKPSIGLYEALVNQGVGNVKVFISLVKQRVIDMFVHNWNTDVNDSTCARWYVLYAEFMFPPCFSLINIEKVCVSLSRFRVSAHRQTEMSSGINQQLYL